MGVSRPARVALLAGIAVLAAVALVSLDRSGSGPARSVSSPPAAASPGTTATARNSAGTAATTTSTTTTTTARAVAASGTYPVGRTGLIVTASNDEGATVDVPTTVWYPEEAAKGTTFPLLVFSPGYQITPSDYDPLTTAWAAAGYVVAEPTYPDTAPGSPPLEYDMVNHPKELSQVITTIVADSAGDGPAGPARSGVPFRGLVDASEIAAAGQSDGGDVSLAAIANSCCTDHRIKAAVILSGAEATLFHGSYFAAGAPPLLAVQGDADTINPPPCSAQLYDAAPDPRYYLDIPSATHLSAYTQAGPQLQAVQEVTISFLDGYLKAMTSPLAVMAQQAASSGVAQLLSGTATVPIDGSCPGAPPASPAG